MVSKKLKNTCESFKRMVKRTKYNQRIHWLWEMRSIPDLCKIHFHGVAGQKPGCCELKMGEKHKDKKIK